MSPVPVSWSVVSGCHHVAGDDQSSSADLSSLKLGVSKELFDCPSFTVDKLSFIKGEWINPFSSGNNVLKPYKITHKYNVGPLSPMDLKIDKYENIAISKTNHNKWKEQC